MNQTNEQKPGFYYAKFSDGITYNVLLKSDGAIVFSDGIGWEEPLCVEEQEMIRPHMKPCKAPWLTDEDIMTIARMAKLAFQTDGKTWAFPEPGPHYPRRLAHFASIVERMVRQEVSWLVQKRSGDLDLAAAIRRGEKP